MFTLILIFLVLFLLGYPRLSGSSFAYAEWLLGLIVVILILQLLGAI